jgi:hypothetical protein
MKNKTQTWGYCIAGYCAAVEHHPLIYYIETKAMCCLTHVGQLLGSHQILGGEGGWYFCRFYLEVCNEVFIAINTINNKNNTELTFLT